MPAASGRRTPLPDRYRECGTSAARPVARIRQSASSLQGIVEDERVDLLRDRGALAAEHLDDAVDIVVGIEYRDRQPEPVLVGDDRRRHLTGLQRLGGGAGILQRKRERGGFRAPRRQR